MLETRWPLLFTFVAIIAGLRFLHLAVVAPMLAERARTPFRLALPATLPAWIMPAVIGFILVYPLLAMLIAGPGAGKWIDNFGIQILIYVLLGWGLNIVVGLAGLLDLGYVAFYAIGAYTCALLGKQFDLSFWMLLPLAGILAAFWGVLLGFPVLRLRGDYLAVVTLAFGEIIRLVLINWVDGDPGLCRHQRPAAPDFLRPSVQRLTRRICGTASGSSSHRCTAWCSSTTSCSPRSSSPQSSSDGCAGCRSDAPGRPCARTRSPAARSASTPPMPSSRPSPSARSSAASRALSSPHGRASSARNRSTSANSALILAIVVLGGMGSTVGVAIAAVVIIGGTEALRELDFLKQIFGAEFDPAQYRMLLFGFAMVVIIAWKPRGFIGTREPSLVLKRAQGRSTPRWCGRGMDERSGAPDSARRALDHAFWRPCGRAGSLLHRRARRTSRR